MKSIIFRSVLIALVFGAVATLLLNYFTATYFEYSRIDNDSNIITGIDAIKETIRSFGLLGYLVGLIAPYIFITASIFFGCLLQGYLQFRKTQGHS